ncbi:MAG: hypothetical protein QM742_19270 [Aquabacterium sp.]
MAHSSILGSDRAPALPPGRDVESLGPSDTSDTGSDVAGTLDLNETDQKLGDLHTRPRSEDSLRQEIQRADSDTSGTGERASAILSEDLREGADIAPDQIVDAPDGVPLDESELDDDSLAA